MHRAIPFAIAPLLSLAAAAAPARAGAPGVSFELYADITFAAITVAHEPDDTDDTLYILRRSGHILSGPRTDPASFTQFMRIPNVSLSFEGGALGIAFHPDYQNNRKFYVLFTQPNVGMPQRSILAEYTATPDGSAGDIASERRLLTIPQDAGIHQAGWIGFGPDGYLYVAVGDDDNQANGQSLATLKGKVLRLDVDADDFPEDPDRNYAIPADNPFVGTPGAMGEIWVYGVRNPYRCAFDRDTGDLYITDVGRSDREEITVIPASSTGGENLGWACREGTDCRTPACCSDPGFTDPTFEYPHANGCAVIGGYVYRGCAMPGLRGTYFFADFCRNTINSWKWDGTTGVTDLEFPSDTLVGINAPVGFGEDAMGEIYVCAFDGKIYKLVPTNPVDDNNNGVVDSCETSACPGDCDASGAVDFNDLVTMLFDFGTPGSSPACDADDSGTVDFNDLVTALFLFGPCL